MGSTATLTLIYLAPVANYTKENLGGVIPTHLKMFKSVRGLNWDRVFFTKEYNLDESKIKVVLK